MTFITGIQRRGRRFSPMGTSGEWFRWMGGQPRTMSLAGCYAREGEEEVIPLPHWLHAPLEVDGEPVRISPVDYRQRLDLRAGELNTGYTDAGKRIRVEVEAICHRARRNLGYYRVEIEALAETMVTLWPRLALPTTRRAPKLEARPVLEGEVCGWDLSAGGMVAAQRMVVRGSIWTPTEQDRTVGRLVDQTIDQGRAAARGSVGGDRHDGNPAPSAGVRARRRRTDRDPRNPVQGTALRRFRMCGIRKGGD